MALEDAVAIPVGPGPAGPASAEDAVEGRTVEGRVGDGRAGVRLEAGRRPESAAHVSLEGWEGPLGLLLALIEARQLDVLTVPLGSLAGAYLEAIATIDGDRMSNVSAFVAVAS